MKIFNFNFNFFVLLTLCIVSGVIVWVTQARIDDHHNYHLTAAGISTQKSADDIAKFIDEKKRLVTLFSNRYADILSQLLDTPDDDMLYNHLEAEIFDYFPQFYTFTVTDDEGQPYAIDFDGRIGDLCNQDIDRFSADKNQHIRIHPSDVYHFDIMSQFKHKQTSGIFFISFNADILSDSLRNVEAPGHQMLLILPEFSDLIEVTATGARDKWIRDDYRMNEEEKSRILSTSPVPNSNWQTIDLQHTDLFSAFSQTLYQQSGMIIFILFMSGIVFILLNHAEVRRRQQAEKSKDEFLSIVSHELRTPLTAIDGALQLIRNGVAGPISEKGQEMTQIAINNTYRLAMLVNDLLDVQRLESGRMRYERELIKPADVIQHAIDNLEDFVKQHQCTVILTNKLKDELINADENRLEQVMVNLISNAAKYGGTNDRIEVQLSIDSHHVVIAVTDHGNGISADNHNKIFEKFTQSNMADNRQSSGSGLGLYITKIIVEDHGGRISYISNIGQGTTFYVELPIATKNHS